MQAFHTYQLLLAATGIFCLLCSLWLFVTGKKISLSVFLLLGGALLVRLCYSTLDPYLNEWDEQYHALVAKNLLLHPLTPTLYEHPALPYYMGNWVEEHVWLHKQPLFLWQIALSYKIFGVSAFATRLPSVILSALAAYFIYRIGKRSVNERAGYIGAFLYAVGYFSLELIVNRFPTDHNDISFHFYVTASLWAWVEYRQSRQWKWIVLAGVFSGMAVLVKWLVGLLVFAGWGISIVLSRERKKISSYIHLAAAFIIALIICVPWQLYILYKFPAEAALSYRHNALHFTEVVEGHGGDALFYFTNLRTMYGGGQLVPFLILAALIFFFYKVRDAQLRIAFVTCTAGVYLFYSLAATKMVSFCYIASPFIFLALGTLMEAVIAWLETRPVKRTVITAVSFTIVIITGLVCFDISQFQQKHLKWRSGKDPVRMEYHHDMEIIRSLNSELPANTVLFNCKGVQNIAAMFYLNRTAYNRVPSQAELRMVQLQGYRAAVFDNGKLPAYIKNDPLVITIGKGYYTFHP